MNKFYSDNYYHNSYFADITGLSLDQVNSMERQFLYIIDYNLVINTKDYEDYHQSVNLFFNQTYN